MPKNLGVTLPWPRPFLERILRGHVRIVPGKMCVKFEAGAVLALA